MLETHLVETDGYYKFERTTIVKKKKKKGNYVSLVSISHKVTKSLKANRKDCPEMSEVDIYCIILILPAFFISSSASLHKTNSRLLVRSPTRCWFPRCWYFYFTAITLNVRRGGEASRGWCMLGIKDDNVALAFVRLLPSVEKWPKGSN